MKSYKPRKGWVCQCDCGGTSVRKYEDLKRAKREGREIGCMACRKKPQGRKKTNRVLEEVRRRMDSK